jgi:hypothetical protein
MPRCERSNTRGFDAWTEVIRPGLVRSVTAMMTAASCRLDRKGRGMEWLGLDFLIDDALGVHLLEANVSPDASHSTRVCVGALPAWCTCPCACVCVGCAR